MLNVRKRWSLPFKAAQTKLVIVHSFEQEEIDHVLCQQPEDFPEDSEVILVMEKNGIPDGPAIGYLRCHDFLNFPECMDRNGFAKFSTGNMFHGQKSGPWQMYYKNAFEQRETYEKDVLNGPFKIFTSGSIFEGHYKNGEMEGETRSESLMDGCLHKETYKQGVLEGPCEYTVVCSREVDLAQYTVFGYQYRGMESRPETKPLIFVTKGSHHQNQKEDLWTSYQNNLPVKFSFYEQGVLNEKISAEMNENLKKGRLPEAFKDNIDLIKLVVAQQSDGPKDEFQKTYPTIKYS